jgi:hypothetical protein
LDRWELLKVLYSSSWNSYLYSSCLRPLKPSEVDNKTVVEFIDRYGGDMDGNGDSWGEQQLELLYQVQNWKLEEIEAKVALYRDEWNGSWMAFNNSERLRWYSDEQRMEGAFF